MNTRPSAIERRSANRSRLVRSARLLAVNGFAGSYVIPKRLRAAVYRAAGFSIAADSTIFSGVIVRTERLAVGRGVFINHNCSFGDGAITLGDYVYLGVGTVLASSDHVVGRSEHRAGRNRVDPIAIERGCWLGAGVVVLAGVTIRAGCIIGAGAVVTRDTEPDGVYLGVPARRTRDLPVD